MTYSIDQFSKISGISKLVLRSWESRHNYLKAERTKSNIRIYSDQLLVQALKTQLLLKSGHKISQISQKSESEIENLISDIKNMNSVQLSYDYFINKFIESGINFDSELFISNYNECMSLFSIVDLYSHIMLPTFSKIGLFWLTNKMNPAQEHFLSEMFKQKMYSIIDTFKLKPKKSNWLLFLPPEEYHEIGLLFARLLLLKKGFNVIYLGTNVPLNALKKVSDIKSIDNLLFFSISNFSKSNLDETINFINNYFKQSNKFLVTNTTCQINKLIKDEDIRVIEDISQFLSIISS